jgi:hypothetical protein
MNAFSFGIEKAPGGSAHAPALDAKNGLPHTVLIFVASGLLFLFARSLVWGQNVSLEDWDMLAAGVLPFAAALGVGRFLPSPFRTSPSSVSTRVLGYAWVTALLTYVVLHVLRLFDQFERPIRAAFEPGLMRYVSYGLFYSLVGYVVVLAIAWAFARQTVTRSDAIKISVGFAASALYFGVALFMFRL